MCLLQRHIKRLLAYSTIAHIGLFLLGLSALSPAGVAAAAVYLAGHAAVKGALFLLAGILLSRYSCVDEWSLFGRSRTHRGLGALFVLGALILAGLPPFGAGLGKAMLEEGSHSAMLTTLIVVVSALTGGAALRAGLRVYFGLGRAPDTGDGDGDEVTGRHQEPDTRAALTGPTPATMTAAVLVLFAIAFLLGLPTRFTTAVGPAAQAFTDSADYRWVALYGYRAPALWGAPPADWTVAGTLLGLLSTALAVAVAAAALYADRLPVERLRLSVRPAVSVLHRLHSGHVGDYAAWLVAGAALATGLLSVR
jgi:multicomponent Na+:H+ antiporter subunit D